MPKNKKKPVSQRTKATLSNKQLKNRFLDKIKFIVDFLAGEKIFDQLTKIEKDILFRTRYYFPKLIYSENCRFTTKEKKSILQICRFYFGSAHVDIIGSELSIDIATFVTSWVTLSYFVNAFPEDKFKTIPLFREKLQQFTANTDIIDDAMLSITVLLNQISRIISRVDRIYVFEDLPTNYQINDITGRYQQYQVKCYEAQWKKFRIENKTHSAFQLGITIPTKSFIWITINAELFNSADTQGKQVIEVYIQQHAIKRFIERIDFDDLEITLINLYSSFETPEIITYRNRLLVKFKFDDFNVGYFMGELNNGIFLIRTFLFITNNGTPEGDKLNGLLKISKTDKEYLNIDKFSTFIKMNTSEMEELKELFTQSDIQNLFTLAKSLKSKGFTKNENEYKGKIKKYFSFKGDADYENDFQFEFSESEVISE